MARLSKKVKIAIFVVAGIILLTLALCAGATLSRSVPVDFLSTVTSIFMKVISVVMIILFIASIAMLILTFRKPKKVSVLSLIISVSISLVTLVVYSALIHYEPPWWMWLLMLALGAAVGFFWARTTKLFVKNNQVMSRNSVWYLVAWGGIFAINQIITIVTNRPPDIAMALLLVSTATVWGTNGNIVWRYYRTLSEINSQVATDALTKPIRTGSQAKPATKLPVHAEIKTGEATIKTTSAAGPCSKCGASLPKNARFCMKCGEKL